VTTLRSSQTRRETSEEEEETKKRRNEETKKNHRDTNLAPRGEKEEIASCSIRRGGRREEQAFHLKVRFYISDDDDDA